MPCSLHNIRYCRGNGGHAALAPAPAVTSLILFSPHDRPYFQRIRDLGDAGIGADLVLFAAQCAGPPTPPAIGSLPALIGTPPPTPTTFGICSQDRPSIGIFHLPSWFRCEVWLRVRDGVGLQPRRTPWCGDWCRRREPEAATLPPLSTITTETLKPSPVHCSRAPWMMAMRHRHRDHSLDLWGLRQRGRSGEDGQGLSKHGREETRRML